MNSMACLLSVFINSFPGCEVTVGHWTCLTNLEQCPIEKQFLLLNVRTMFIKNLSVVKP